MGFEYLSDFGSDRAEITGRKYGTLPRGMSWAGRRILGGRQPVRREDHRRAVCLFKRLVAVLRDTRESHDKGETEKRKISLGVY